MPTIASARSAACALLLGWSGWHAGPAVAQERVLLTRGEALREIFPEAAWVAERIWRPTPEVRAELAAELGSGARVEFGYEILLVYDVAGAFRGSAVVTEDHGKYRPITFMVGVTPEGKVRDTAVMVYREDRGSEVQRRRFLRQYRGKSIRDPVRAGRDVQNVSGATISVNSLNGSVRKVLRVVWAAFRGDPPEVSPAERKPIREIR